VGGAGHAGGDFGGRLGGQLQFQFLQQQAEFGFGLGIAGEQQFAAVGGRQMHVDHLYGSKLLQHGSRRQTRRQRVQAPRQCHVQAIGQKGDEDMCLDAGLELVKDRPDREIALEVLERLLDRHQQQVMAPQLGRVFLDEIGAQQVPAFARSCLPQFVAIEPIAEGGAVCSNLDRD
jgi:hypothetical protein